MSEMRMGEMCIERGGVTTTDEGARRADLPEGHRVKVWSYEDGQPCIKWEYQKPGSHYWTDAIKILEAYAGEVEVKMLTMI